MPRSKHANDHHHRVRKRRRMTTVQWTNRQLANAVGQLQLFVSELQGHGPTGYKAGRLLGEWRSAHSELSKSARKLIGEYVRKVDDGKGGTVELPTQQDGRPVASQYWATNPAEYDDKDEALMAVSQEISVPVRFTYEELAAIPTIRGSFWEALSPCIDAPKEPAAVPAPAPPVPAPATARG